MRWISYIVFSSYLITQTSVVEFARLYELFDHFLEHRADCSQLTLTDFFAMHYGSNAASNHSDDHSDRLPFSHPLLPQVALQAVIPTTLRCECPIFTLHSDHAAWPFRLKHQKVFIAIQSPPPCKV
jgi:hypothetical protein